MPKIGRRTQRDHPVRFGPIQKDKSRLVYVFDKESDETHDILVSTTGDILSENIWGGYNDLPQRCPKCNGSWECTEFKNQYQCWECGEIGWDGYHCLVLIPPERYIYQGNKGISHFHWKDVDLEVW